MQTQPALTTPEDVRTQLDISDMTCASCANHIERKLNKIPGVDASVNFATEKATVDAPGDISTQQLLDAVSDAGYSAQVKTPDKPQEDETEQVSAQEKDLASLKNRVIITAWLGIPVILISMIPALQLTYWQWACLTLTAPIAMWSAYPFHKSTWQNLKHLSFTMDTLVSVGISAAFLWSLYALFLGTAGETGMKHAFYLTIGHSDGASNIYLETVAGVTLFILAGRYFENKSKLGANKALTALLDEGAKQAIVLEPRDGKTPTTPDADTDFDLSEYTQKVIPASDLQVGQLFLVRPGEKVGTDGTVLSGVSSIDSSLITGESVPQSVHPKDKVIGGTLNTSGSLIVEATHIGSDTQLSQMVDLVEQAQTSKSPSQSLADKISGVFVPVVFVIAITTLIVWLALGHSAVDAFSAAIAVLIIACPCALGLATPIALMMGTGRGAQLGILIKSQEALENTRTVNTIVMDKTGTVTTGIMAVVSIEPAPQSDLSQDDILHIAGALEQRSEHPIAQAIAHADEDSQNADSPDVNVENFENNAGHSITGDVSSSDARLNGHYFLGRPESSQQSKNNPATIVSLQRDGQEVGVITLSDQVKPEAKSAIDELKKLDVTPALLTGDNAQIADQIGSEIGISTVIAGVLPAQKASTVKELQGEDKVVAMVGDGVNDAPALAQADLSMAMGTGSDAALETSDITIVNGNLKRVPDAIRLSRSTLHTIKTNLFWAFAYNTAAIPLAALGLLNPMIAGAAMALSSVFVVTNSLRLRRFKAS